MSEATRKTNLPTITLIGLLLAFGLPELVPGTLAAGDGLGATGSNAFRS